MDAIKQIISFLSSLWGILAVAAIAFPGATTLLKLPIATSNSTIADWYPVIGTIVSAFSTLFLIAYKDELTDLKFARKLAVLGMALGLLFFFSFVSVRVFVLDIRSEQKIVGESKELLKIVMKDHGIILTEIRNGGQNIFSEEKGDPFDVLELILFAGTFASLTFGFTALGIHAYQKSQL